MNLIDGIEAYLACRIRDAAACFREALANHEDGAGYFLALIEEDYPALAEGGAAEAVREAREGNTLSSLWALRHEGKLTEEERAQILARKQAEISAAESSQDPFSLEEAGLRALTGAPSLREKGLALLEKAAEKGYWKADYDLGLAHDGRERRNPYGTDAPDYEKAKGYYEKALSLGAPQAAFRLAFLLYEGKGGAPRKSEAEKLWRKSLGRGYGPSGTALGFVLLFSDSPADRKEGFRLTKKAAELADPTGMGNLANCYLYGKGTKKDRRQAKLWYEKAAQLGMASSAMQLGVLFHEEGNDRKALPLFREAASKGFTPAMGWLAACYRNGYGTEPDDKAARFWLENAAQRGDREALQALALMDRAGT